MKVRKVWDARFGFGVVVRENAEFVYVQFSGREYLRTYKKFLGEDSNLKDRGWIDIP